MSLKENLEKILEESGFNNYLTQKADRLTEYRKLRLKEGIWDSNINCVEDLNKTSNELFYDNQSVKIDLKYTPGEIFLMKNGCKKYFEKKTYH